MVEYLGVLSSTVFACFSLNIMTWYVKTLLLGKTSTLWSTTEKGWSKERLLHRNPFGSCPTILLLSAACCVVSSKQQFIDIVILQGHVLTYPGITDACVPSHLSCWYHGMGILIPRPAMESENNDFPLPPWENKTSGEHAFNTSDPHLQCNSLPSVSVQRNKT